MQETGRLGDPEQEQGDKAGFYLALIDDRIAIIAGIVDKKINFIGFGRVALDAFDPIQAVLPTNRIG